MNTWIRSLVAVMAFNTAACLAEDMPPMPKPEKEHAWLEQLEGTWKTETEASMGPDKPPIKMKGKVTARGLGGFWVVEEGQNSTPGGDKMNSRLTLGYDPKTKKYTGTFVSSCDSTHWVYQGSLDETGKKLILETEGPAVMLPSKHAKYRETIEIQDKKHRLFTSSIQTEDGKWSQFMTSKYTKVGK